MRKTFSQLENHNEHINDLQDFKGIYYGDSNEQHFYEAGAHFKYKDLCTRLEQIVRFLAPERRGKSMYEAWGDLEKTDSNLLLRKSEEYSSLVKTNANSRKFASGNSQETLLEKNSSRKLGEPASSCSNAIMFQEKQREMSSSKPSRNVNVNVNLQNFLNKNSYAIENHSRNKISDLGGNDNTSNPVTKTVSAAHNKSNSMAVNSTYSVLFKQHSEDKGNVHQDQAIIQNYAEKASNTSLHLKNPPKCDSTKKIISRNIQNDFLKAGNNTRCTYSNIFANNYIHRTKILNSSALTGGKHIRNATIGACGISDYKNNNGFACNSNNQTRNKNESSALSDLTSSANRTGETTKRKNVNKSNKINIAFANNISNFMASLESKDNATTSNDIITTNANSKLKKSRNSDANPVLGEAKTVALASINPGLTIFKSMMAGIHGGNKQMKLSSKGSTVIAKECQCKAGNSISPTKGIKDPIIKEIEKITSLTSNYLKLKQKISFGMKRGAMEKLPINNPSLMQNLVKVKSKPYQCTNKFLISKVCSKIVPESKENAFSMMSKKIVKSKFKV